MLAVQDVTDLVVSVLDSMDVPDFPARAVLGLVGPELDASMANFQELDRRTGTTTFVAPGCSPGNKPIATAFFHELWTTTPLIPAADHGDVAPWTAESVFGSAEAWRRSGAHHLLRAMGGGDRAAGVPLTVDATRVSGLAFSRSGRDFTEAQLSLLGTLRPLVCAVERHARQAARWREDHGADAQRAVAAARDTGLTAREVAVLSLLAGGCTATAT